MDICVCGGGNLAHTVAGYIGSKQGYRVRLLTRRPGQWQSGIKIQDCSGKVLEGHFQRISDKASEVVPGSDIILLCLPGFAIADSLERIRPCLDGHQQVGSIVSSTGFFFAAHDLLPEGTGLFGFQRVPFISRISSYGRAASILGHKQELVLGTESVPSPQELAGLFQEMLDTPVRLAGNYLDVALSNSNPILHPSRLYTLFKEYREGMTYPRHCLFYEDWDDESSSVLTECDREFFRILDRLPVSRGSITPLLEYYESRGIEELTRKIRSITAFKGLKAPMKAVEGGGYVPDFNDRYFREDFPFGISILCRLARQTGTSVPCMDRIMEWGREFIPQDGHEPNIKI